MTQYATMSQWKEVDLLTTEKMDIRKPINIVYSKLNEPKWVSVDEHITFHLVWKRGNAVVQRETSPSFPVPRPMRVDYVAKFEILDEFGFDVGIGFVFGEAKKG